MRTKSFFLIASLLLIVTFIMGFSNGVDRNPNLKRTNAPGQYITTYTPLPTPIDASALSESFEGVTFPPAGWTRIKFSASDPGWIRMTVGTTPLPGWNGGVITVPPGGGTACAFVTYNLGAPSNREWLITPQLTNMQAGDSLIFWKRFWPNTYADTLSILISTTTPTPAAFTILVDRIPFPTGSADTNWTRRGYNIGSLVTPGANIYVGFLEHVLDNILQGATVSVDLVSVTGLVGIHQNGTEVPASYSLNQNYPNPFNPVTNIKFGLPKAGFVNMTVYDINGQAVSQVVNGYYGAGNYTVDFDASKLSSGIYFYTIKSNEFAETKKMILVK